MPFEGFIHPGLALGTLLASVPLLIHLLNRQRHRPMQWAAMRFVMAAYKRTRRRAQIENLILLLLRMAAVFLFALAVARPFTGKNSPLAPLTESRRDLVLVLDGSASTGYRENVESVHEAIVRRGREILADLDGTRGDRVRLIHAGNHPRLLSARSPEDALVALSTLTVPTAEPLHLASVLGEVVDLAEKEAAGTGQSALEVRLLSDLQRRSFTDDTLARAADVDLAELAAAPPIRRALDRLHELGVLVVVEDLGPPTTNPPNIGIESIEPLGPVLGVGTTTEIAVRIGNYGTSGRSGVRVALSVNGQRLPSQKVDVGAESSMEAIFPVVVRDGGYVTLEAELEGDRLAIDDERSLVLWVPPAIRVLLVNGEPDDEIDKDEVGLLRAVLDPPDDDMSSGFASSGSSPFQARALTSIAFAGSDEELADYDVIVLANTGPLSGRIVDELESWTAAGGSLILTLGERYANASALESFQARMWRSDGSGLLPARLLRAVRVPQRGERYHRASDFDGGHPALAFFADERWRPLFTEVPYYGFVASEPLEDARVLARLDDAEASPLFIEREYDRGRVFLWTSTIDSAWNRVPESPGTFIPFIHEWFRYAGRRPDVERNLAVGATFSAEVASFPRNPVAVSPDGSRRTLDGEPEEVIEGIWRLAPISDTDTPGSWRIELEGADDVRFSVQLAEGEGDLARIPGAELESSHPAWHVYDHGRDESQSATESEADRGELWRTLALLTLACLILETLWAAWIGRGRRLT